MIEAWIGALTAAGALLFYAAGFLMARRPPAGAGVPLHDPAAAERRQEDLTALPAALPAAGKALQALVEDLASRGAIRAAVVADELGLVVAATGAHGDEMAAAGAAVAYAGAQARRLLPVGKLRRMIFEHEHEVILTVRPLELGDGTFCVVTLAGDAGAEGEARQAGGGS